MIKCGVKNLLVGHKRNMRNKDKDFHPILITTTFLHDNLYLFKTKTILC